MREKLQQTAQALGLEVGFQHLPQPPGSPAELADALGCDRRMVAVSTVFVADGDPVVCVTGAGAEVDSDLLADALDAVEIRPASPPEVRAATGFCIEGVPPFGHDVPVLLDLALPRDAALWTTGGDGRSAICLRLEQLVDLGLARRATIAVPVAV